MTVTLNGVSKDIEVEKEGVYTVTFEGDNWSPLSIATNDEIYVDDIELYNYTQDGLIYDNEWNGLRCLEALKNLNSIIASKTVADNHGEVFYDMIARFSEAKVVNRIESEDYPWGSNVSVIDEKDLFLTPNTEVGYEMDLDDEDRNLIFKYGMHSEAAKWGISDGTNLKVLLSCDGKEKEFILDRISSDGAMKDYKLNLSEYKNKHILVTLVCYEDAGKYNEDADWAVVYEPFVE